MITYLILILLAYYVYIKKESFVTNKQTSEPSKKLIKDILKEHIEDTNLEKYNISTFNPTHVLAYNLNSTNEYNILNNYGIKNTKKRESYIKKLNKCNTVPYNKNSLLKNYDTILNKSFTTIYLNHEIHHDCKPEGLTKIQLIGNNNIFQWSYDTHHLKNKFFYIFYKIVDNKCHDTSIVYNSLKIIPNFESSEFSLSVNNYKNRNIYIMNFLVKNKFCDIYIVLSENNNMLIKSNNIIVKN